MNIQHRRFIGIIVFILYLVACGGGDGPPPDKPLPPPVIPGLYFVDAHTQISVEVNLDDVLDRMHANGIAKSILAARGGRSSTTITDFAQLHGNEIAAMIKVKGNDYANNTPRYYTQLEARANSGLYGAIGEVLIFHAAKGDRAPEVNVALNDPRVTAALTVAKSNQWPLVIHIEFAALDANRVADMWNSLKEFLSTHASHPIVLIHMAQLQADKVAELLAQHANVYFITSHSNPVILENSSQPWVNMFVGEYLAPEWEQLIIDYPQRFIFALDNVWPEHWEAELYKDQIDFWSKAMTGLPVDVAHAIAHGNAERLWSLFHVSDGGGG